MDLTSEPMHERDHPLFQALFEMAPSGMILVDADGCIVKVNRRAEAMFGWPLDDLVGKPVEVLVPIASQAAHVERHHNLGPTTRARRVSEGRPVLAAHRRGDGVFSVEVDLAFVETDGGRMVVASVMDVSGRPEAKAEIESGRPHLANIIEGASQAMLLFDDQDLVIGSNHHWRDLFQSGDPLGSSYEQMLRAVVVAGVMEVRAGQQELFIARELAAHQRADGASSLHRLTGGRVISLSHRRTREGGIMTAASDMTETLQQQQRVREMQRMNALGKLTGGLAHDFNNYLNVIIGSLDLLETSIPDAAGPSELFHAAREMALRAAELTRSLLVFARKQPMHAQVCDLRETLESLGDLLARTLGGKIVTHTDIDVALWPVHIDSALFETSIIHLANNAKDAMPGGGELRIAGRNVRIEDADATEDAVAGSYVCASVTDTGTGMSPDVLRKILEPFFTTKVAEHGTGLGLSMIYGFVKQSGGFLRVSSELGQGTTVRMYLPRAEADDPVEVTESTARHTSKDPPGGEMLLVVEDDAANRRTVVRRLSVLGYRTLEAGTGEEALEVLREHGHDIALLFTDIVMSGRTEGFELANLVERQYPRIRILLTSGYPGEAWERAGDAGCRWPLLNKPYRGEELAVKIRTVLDGPEEPSVCRGRLHGTAPAR